MGEIFYRKIRRTEGEAFVGSRCRLLTVCSLRAESAASYQIF